MRKIFLFGLVTFWSISLYSQKNFSLEECRDLALTNSKKLKITEDKIDIAQANKKKAFVQNLPNISATGAYMKDQYDMALLHEDKFIPLGKFMPDGSWVPTDAGGVPFDPAKNPEKMQYAYLPKEELVFETKNIFMGGLSLVQPIYMGGKIRALNKMAKIGEDVALAQHENEKMELIYSVDAAYWQVVSIANKVKLAEKFKELITLLHTDIKHMAEEGLATQSDLLKVNVKLNEVNLQLTKANNGLSLSKMSLCQIIGVAMDTEFVLKDEEPIFQIHNQEDLGNNITKALKQRTDLKQLELYSNLSLSKIKLEQAEFLPTLGFSANYLMTNPNLNNGFDKSFGGRWNMMVMLKVPIFHFFERQHTVRAAKLEHSIVQHRLEEAKEIVELQVRQSTYRINESNNKLQMSELNLGSAQENMRIAEEGYKEGVISLSDFMSAQTAWLSAYNDRIDAAIDSKLCKVYLEKAIGELKNN